MKNTRLDGLYYWARYQADRKIDFNGFYWKRADGGLLIDPMPLEADEIAQIEELGGAKQILISNADHLRAAPELKEHFGASILAPEGDRDRFAEQASCVDEWYEDSSDLPAGIEVRFVHGGKSPVEPFFHLTELNALLFADAVRSHVSGTLMLLPEAKLQDRPAVLESLACLAEFEPEAILLGDGDCLFRGASEELARFHKSLQ